MLKAVVDGGYSGAEYTMELSMATADPVLSARIVIPPFNALLGTTERK